MSGLPLALLVAVMAALSFGARQDPTTGKKIVPVEIVIESHDNNTATCKKGGVPPTTIFADMDAKKVKHVHHCVDGSLIDHSIEKQDPKTFDQTLVQLSSRDSVRWFSKTSKFRVTLIEKHAPMSLDAPAYPFTNPIPGKPGEYFNSVIVGEVLNLQGEITQRYKASFDIEGFGEVDPDLVCSM